MEILNKILSEIFAEDKKENRTLQELVKSCYRVSSGGVTMKNMSRLSEEGCRYRTIQRLMLSPINWLMLSVVSILLWLSKFSGGMLNEKRYILAVDEVVEGKSRTATYGISYFFSSIVGKPIRSICSQVLTIVDTKHKKSLVLCQDQRVRELKKKHPSKKTKKKKQSVKSNSKKKAESGKRGRPKGSKSKLKTIEWCGLYHSLNSLLTIWLSVIHFFKGGIKYLVADGTYGNKNVGLLVKQYGLELISKLQPHSTFYFAYQGEKKLKIYGEKLTEYSKKYLVKEVIDEKGSTIQTYHYPKMRSKKHGYPLNLVIIVKTKKNGNESKVVLFSTCLQLSWEEMIHFYSCRFQIEFNFRDAKQYFGLSDFKNTKKQSVTNAINFSFLMCNISNLYIEIAKEQWECDHLSILDIKSMMKAQKYIDSVLNYTQKNGKPILTEQQHIDILTMGSVNLGFLKKKKAS